MLKPFESDNIIWLIDSQKKIVYTSDIETENQIQNAITKANSRFFVTDSATDNKQFICYVQNIAGSDLFLIIASDYSHYLSKIQADILRELEAKRYQDDSYFYVINSKNLRLLMHPYSTKVGTILADEENYGGRKINVELLQAAENNKNGAYYSYVQRKQNSKIKEDKLVYCRFYEDWSWLICSNIDILKIERAALEKQDEVQDIININVAAIAIILVIFVAVILFYFRILTRKIRWNVVFFLESLRIAVRKHEQIETEKFSYTEVQKFAESINYILAEQARTFAELKDSQQFFKLLSQKIRTAIYTFGADGKFIYMNNAMKQITGYSRQELREMKFWELVHPDHRELVKKVGTTDYKRKMKSQTTLLKF